MSDEFDPDKFATYTDFDPAKLAATAPQSLSWSEVPGKAAQNFRSSAAQFGHDIVQPFVHPVETAQGIGNIGLGTLRKVGNLPGMTGPVGLGLKTLGKLIPEEKEKYPEAVGTFFKDRYGGTEAIKNTLATDPVGALADAATVLSGGELAAARAPGVIGQAGRIAGTVGRVVDPLTIPIKGAEAAGKFAAHTIGGLGTHTGAESIKTAFNAGREGGEAAERFQENLRSRVEPGDMVDYAREAVDQIRKERSTAYKAGMAESGKNPTVLDFNKIDKSLVDITGVQTFHGQVLNPKTQAIREEIGQTVHDWKQLDPEIFHTVEGLDALKRKIGNIRDATQYGTPERVVADNVYNAIKRTIIKEDPQYAKTMKGYEEASKQIKEIERTLSLNPNATVDTALRKLQSVLRNNVNTNFGQRQKLAEYLTKVGAPHLMEALAGQALNSWVPRGLAKLVGTDILMHGITKGVGLGAAGIMAGPVGAAAALPLMSPRLMGETAYYAGKAAGYLPPARQTGRAAYQPGRASEVRPIAGTAEQETPAPRWSELNLGRKRGGKVPPAWWQKAKARVA